MMTSILTPRTIFLASVIFGVMALGFIPSQWPTTPAVQADHDDPRTTHLLRDPDDPDDTHGRIVRNIIDGNGIPVCSDHYPVAAGYAALRWNAFFLHHAVFRVRGDNTAFPTNHPVCQFNNRPNIVGVQSVIVTYQAGKCTYSACIFLGLQDPDERWDSFTGQPRAYIGDYRVWDSATGTIVDMRLPDNNPRVIRSITHELGHVFGFEDYDSDHCRAAPSGNPYLLDYTTNPTVMSGQAPVVGTANSCYSTRPTDLQDLLVYRASYIPKRPSIDGSLQARSPRPGVVEFRLDVLDVHVESEFEIQKRDQGGSWVTVKTYAAKPMAGEMETQQPIDVVLNAQPLGAQVYRAVSKSEAPRLGNTVSASNEIPVTVMGPRPNTPAGLAGTAVVNGIRLSWDAATDEPPIEGYEYRVNSGNRRKIANSNEQTTHFVVRGLSSGIEYSVQIRSARAKNWSQPTEAVRATPLASCPTGHVPDSEGFCIENKCVTQERPSNDAFSSSTSSRETRMVPVFVPPLFNCEFFEEARTVTTTTTYFISYSCVDLCWQSSANVSVSTSYGQWSRTGNLGGSCNVRRAVGGAGTVLSAGDYDLQWNDQRIRFTVPTGATVTLSGRQLDNGDYVAVLTLKQGRELVIGADALDGDDLARSARFSSTTDNTLRSIADSLRDPSTVEAQASVTTTSQCAVAEASDDGTTSVDLDGDSCVIVRDGGAVTVSLADESHTLSLATGREWLIVDASETNPEDTAPATFVDLSSGGYITLSLFDGSELGRHIPDGDATLGTLFDAMRAPEPDDSAPAGGSPGDSRPRH